MTAMTGSLPDRARAIFLLGPGKLALREVEVPRPGPGELLVAIEAATTCGTDLKVFRRGGHPRMLEVPGPFGHEMTGRIAAVGGVGGTGGIGRGFSSPPFREGDAVVVANSASCGICPACRGGRENLCPALVYLNGGFADFLLVPALFVARATYRRPPGLAPELAALAEPLACVEHGLARLGESGERSSGCPVLVLGGGALGLLFVAVLSQLGHCVTAADPHSHRLDLARRMGATATIPMAPSTGGGAQAPGRLERVEREYDIAIDATGTVSGWQTAVEATRPGGTTLFFGGCAPADRIELATYPIHYDELSLLGTYHHTPRSFGAAIARLGEARSDFRALLTYEETLPNVESALCAMMDRRALKVVIRPNGSGANAADS